MNIINSLMETNGSSEEFVGLSSERIHELNAALSGLEAGLERDYPGITTEGPAEAVKISPSQEVVEHVARLTRQELEKTENQGGQSAVSR